MIVSMNIAVDSASPVSFLKQNVLHELKLRYPNLKNYPVEKKLETCFVASLMIPSTFKER